MRAVALTLLGTLVLAACGSGASGLDSLPGPDQTPGGTPIRIGADLDTSGPAAAYNQQVRDGIDLAIEVVNRRGGVLGRPLELVAKNSQSDPAKGPATYNALLEEGVVAAIGYVTVAVPPVKALIQERKLLTIAAASTTASMVDAPPSDYLYSILPTGQSYAEVFCGAFAKTGARRVALFHDNAPGVILLVDGYRQLFRSCLPDGFVVEESAPVDATDFAAPAARIADAKPDAVLTVSVGGSFQAQSETALAAALPDVQRFSIGAFDGQPDSWRVAGAGALDGLVAVRPVTTANPRTAELEATFRTVHGDDFTLAQTHVLGYDSVMLLADAITQAGTADDRDAVNTAFRRITSYQPHLGQSGFTLSFGADKHVGADGACGLVLAQFGPDNTLTGDWPTFQQPC
ncbi:ABC transporter substrate-binding protein [Pseudonocardia pini]|uniref:ABC transporter substrate-binding protein n=1 Tax=Pseudonocardia pini TaxID=2758030 RepID=UPI0015F0F917|nr:ABC transporter substrate-binding protein [Pseudonocardia pini]